MDWRERLVGVEVGKSWLDEKLTEEDHDFSELGICLDRRERYRQEVDRESVILRGQNYCCDFTSIIDTRNLASLCEHLHIICLSDAFVHGGVDIESHLIIRRLMRKTVPAD